jgi:hypothetical protein
MWTAAAINESFRPGHVVAIDPAVSRWAGDSICATQVRCKSPGQTLKTGNGESRTMA